MMDLKVLLASILSWFVILQFNLIEETSSVIGGSVQEGIIFTAVLAAVMYGLWWGLSFGITRLINWLLLKAS